MKTKIGYKIGYSILFFAVRERRQRGAIQGANGATKKQYTVYGFVYGFLDVYGFSVAVFQGAKGGAKKTVYCTRFRIREAMP